ncbi:MAG TPA: MaoC family dehydratase N-terminal domain-containing protein [Dehalococcoidia bacterium]|nr:MaoC family dehydratase N-terminal domain-containing protein [Dehalococcoidia bacterium]
MTQQQESVITDEMRARIGVESEPVPYEVDNTGCRQFARAVNYSDPIYFDEVAAKAKGHRGIVAPFGFLGHPVVVPGGPTRVPEAFRLDIPYKRVLNGGTDIEYLQEVCAGDRLTATTKLSNLTEREGKIGPMLIVETETTFRNENGETVAIQRGTAIRY